MTVLWSTEWSPLENENFLLQLLCNIRVTAAVIAACLCPRTTLREFLLPFVTSQKRPGQHIEQGNTRGYQFGSFGHQSMILGISVMEFGEPAIWRTHTVLGGTDTGLLTHNRE